MWCFGRKWLGLLHRKTLSQKQEELKEEEKKEKEEEKKEKKKRIGHPFGAGVNRQL